MSLPAHAYARCAYCSTLLPLDAFIEHAAHSNLCPAALPLGCFSCGAAELASATQRARAADGLPARCAACVQAGCTARLTPTCLPPTLEDALEEAVSACDNEGACAALAAGADPNAARQAQAYVHGRAVKLWTAAGARLAEDDPDD